MMSSSNTTFRRHEEEEGEEEQQQQQQQQLLVQFHSQTHVMNIIQAVLDTTTTSSCPLNNNNNDDDDDATTTKTTKTTTTQKTSSLVLFQIIVLNWLSIRTQWPVQYLQITHWNVPFVQVRTISSIKGGKGGFGTLLKGQSRQAGAKLTTDFGACRDLQGRRLRHVNDEIKLRKFRERQQKQKQQEAIARSGNETGGAGVEDVEDMWKTPSGIYNWYLLTPTWADISKKAAYRIKRQFQQMERDDQKKLAMKQEQEEIHQKTITNYLSETNAMSESVQHDLLDAIQQGLQSSSKETNNNNNTIATNKKRKHYETPIEDVSETIEFSDEDQPNSLVRLTGDAIIEAVSSNSSSSSSIVQLQSKSDFMTAVWVLDPGNNNTINNNSNNNNTSSSMSSSSSYYYEVTLVTGGLAQIGWACLFGTTTENTSLNDYYFQPNNETGDGVGDDACSFAVDGSRGLKFHNGKEWEYGIKWKAGDCLGCILDYHHRHHHSDNEEVVTTTTTISFSLNGKDLGVAFTTTLKPLVPAFSCNQGEILELHMTKDDCIYFPKQDKKHILAVKDEPEDNVVRAPTNTVTTNDETPKVLSDMEDKKPAAIQSSTEFSKPNKTIGQDPSTTPPTKLPIKPEPLLNLETFQSAKELETLGLDRLKSALMAMQVKCGGTLQERAQRLFSLKGLARKDYPSKVRGKGFVVE